MNRKLVARTLVIIALVEAGLAGVYWLAAGANTGWTKNRVEVISVDEATGLEARTWEDRFVPGIELLGATLLGAGALAGTAIFVRRSKPNPQNAT